MNSKYGRRTFEYVGPRLWNALPLKVRTEERIDNFKRQVKTILFDGTEEFKQITFQYD